MEAAELVAFSVFDPALRSRGGVRATAAVLAGEPEFQAEMEGLFSGPPAGCLVLPSLWGVAERLDAVERRLAELERRVGGG